MSYEVFRVSRGVWLEKFHEKSFQNVFGEGRPPEDERCDFALVVSKDAIPFSFVTCRELDAKNLFWQFGGAAQSHKKTVDVMNGLLMFLRWCSERYDSVGFKVENTNLSMIKIALKCGFLIIGTRNFGNETYLELIREF